MGARRPGGGSWCHRRRRRVGGGGPHREPQPPVRGRALRGRRHRRGGHRARRVLDGRATDRAHGPPAVRAARRSTHALPVRARRRGYQRVRQRGRRPDRRRRSRVRRVLSRQPTRQRALPRASPVRPPRAGEGRGHRQPRGAHRLEYRPRRHRGCERPRVGRLRGGIGGEAPERPGRRPVRGEAPHRGNARIARPRPCGGCPGPRRRRHLVRGVGNGGEDRRGDGRRPRAVSPSANRAWTPSR